jgi:hypothetical protein
VQFLYETIIFVWCIYNKRKGKLKVVPVLKHYGMETSGKSGCIAVRTLDLGTSWRWVVNFTPRPLHPRGRSPRYPLDGWTPEPVWTTWRGEKSFPYRDSNSDSSFVHPVASRCTDCAIPALIFNRIQRKNYLPLSSIGSSMCGFLRDALSS